MSIYPLYLATPKLMRPVLLWLIVYFAGFPIAKPKKQKSRHLFHQLWPPAIVAFGLFLSCAWTIFLAYAAYATTTTLWDLTY